MVFENGVKDIQAAAYNGARTVHKIFLAGSNTGEQLVFLVYILSKHSQKMIKNVLVGTPKLGKVIIL